MSSGSNAANLLDTSGGGFPGSEENEGGVVTRLIKGLEESHGKCVTEKPAHIVLSRLERWGLELPEGLRVIHGGVYIVNYAQLQSSIIETGIDLGHLAAGATIAPSHLEGMYVSKNRLYHQTEFIPGITETDEFIPNLGPDCQTYAYVILEKPGFSTTLTTPMICSRPEDVRKSRNKPKVDINLGIYAYNTQADELSNTRVQMSFRGAVHIHEGPLRSGIDGGMYVSYDGLCYSIEPLSEGLPTKRVIFRTMPNSPSMPFDVTVKGIDSVNRYFIDPSGIRPTKKGYFLEKPFGFEAQFSLDAFFRGEIFNPQNPHLPLATGVFEVCAPHYYTVSRSYATQVLCGGIVQIVPQLHNGAGYIVGVEAPIFLTQDQANQYLCEKVGSIL